MRPPTAIGAAVRVDILHCYANHFHVCCVEIRVAAMRCSDEALVGQRQTDYCDENACRAGHSPELRRRRNVAHGGDQDVAERSEAH
jgi:hypothetical protein